MNFLFFMPEACLCMRDSQGKLFVISSEYKRHRYYQRVQYKLEKGYIVDAYTVQEARNKYPEYFV